MIGLVLVLVCLLVLATISSAAETSLTSLSELQINSLKTEKSKAAQRVVRLYKKPDKFLGAILISNNIANIFASSVTALIVGRMLGEGYVMYATSILTLYIIIFGEVSPKQIALVHNETVAKLLSPIVLIMTYVFAPLIWVVSLFGRFFNAVFGGKKRKAFALENILHLVTMGEKAGEVNPYEKSVVYNIFRLSETTAVSITTHRKDVFSLPCKASVSEVLPQVIEEGYSRIPVYGDTAEDIVGIVMQRDIYKAHSEGKTDEKLKNLMMEPLFVPSSMHLDELLKIFNRQALNIAVVLDEYGGLAGIVTREDVLEEILGELYDENEEAEIKTEELADGTWRLQGNTPLYWLEEHTGHRIENKYANTIGGHLIERLDRLPFEGEVIDLEKEGRFQIEKVEKNRIVSLHFFPLPKQSVDDSEDEEYAE